MTKPKWLPVVGREGQYEVSDDGQVRAASGRLMGRWTSDQGYQRVRLSGPRQIVRVHRLVAEAHVPNPEKKPNVNHIDFDRANNAASNLEWCSQGENIRHSERAGRMQRDYWSGRRSPNATLTDQTVAAIRSDYAAGGVSQSELGERYGVGKSTVGKIVRRKSYV